MKIILTLILIILTQFLFAQKEHNIWYFGNNAGIEFTTGVPVAITNGAMSTAEGCATICDSNGVLLFYTNGVNVWDKNHNIMPNGDSLAGHVSSSQSSVIVSFPNSDSLFYIFTTQASENITHDFNYSVVDMSLNGGNGDVTLKNNFLLTPICEKITAIKHSNDSDIWVMVHKFNSDSLFAYLVTSNGVSLTSVISSTGQVVGIGDGTGYMKFSPDGTKIALAGHATNFVELFDFNSTTGIVTNSKHLTCPPSVFGVYGLEFSSSGNYLYASLGVSPATIQQWDITSNNALIINSTIQQVGTSSASYLMALQLGPDCKIYVAEFGEFNIGVINNPEIYGTSCGYIDNAVSLSGFCYLGLPNYVQSNCIMTAINELDLNTNISIFPNPFKDKISISVKEQNFKQQTFRIKNILGQSVFSKQEKNLSNTYAKTIDLSFLSKGIYLLEIIVDGERTVKKIVKE